MINFYIFISLYFYLFIYLSPENIKIIIEKMANYIARNGTEFETLVRQKNIGDERFSFMQPWVNISYK